MAEDYLKYFVEPISKVEFREKLGSAMRAADIMKQLREREYIERVESGRWGLSKLGRARHQVYFRDLK